MNRKILLTFVLAMMMIPAAGCAPEPGEDNNDSKPIAVQDSRAVTADVKESRLAFDVSNYTEHTTTPINLAEQFADQTYRDPSTRGVASAGGTSYRAYENIVYCANPVNTDREVLNVYVPAGHYDDPAAPVLFFIEGGGFQGQSLKYPSGMGRDNYKSLYIDGALKAGMVVVSVNFRGHGDTDAEGRFNGDAPAGLVDLKAAVRYLKYNDAAMPGDARRIVTEGASSGGCYSALVGATANSPLYDPYLKAIGAVMEKGIGDEVWGSAVYCPITDLDHADMAYEWEYASQTAAQGRDGIKEMTDAQKAASAQLAAMYAAYYESLALGSIDELKAHMTGAYLIPAANEYLGRLPGDARDAYLADNPWITWDAAKAAVAAMDFEGYIAHCARGKVPCAFAREAGLFGTPETASNYFTDFQLQFYTGNPEATVFRDILDRVYMMNPYNFVKNGDCAKHWWIRVGTRDHHTAHTVSMNLAELLEKQGRDVSYKMAWDYPHDAEWYDCDELNRWIVSICGASRQQPRQQ